MKTLSLSLLLLVLCACRSEPTTPIGRYQAAVTEGLSSESVPRQGLLGLRTGVRAQDYFDKCTELNRQQVITNGGGGNTIVHQMPYEFDAPATLNLRPILKRNDERTVEGIEAWFNYDSWSPWNKRYYADSLLPHVADYVARDLDLDFIELQHPQHGYTYASVDGNRLTAVWAEDEAKVKAMFVDLALQPGDPLLLARAK